jgi:hypothetical protein
LNKNVYCIGEAQINVLSGRSQRTLTAAPAPALAGSAQDARSPSA